MNLRRMKLNWKSIRGTIPPALGLLSAQWHKRNCLRLSTRATEIYPIRARISGSWSRFFSLTEGIPSRLSTLTWQGHIFSLYLHHILIPTIRCGRSTILYRFLNSNAFTEHHFPVTNLQLLNNTMLSGYAASDTITCSRGIQEHGNDVLFYLKKRL